MIKQIRVEKIFKLGNVMGFRVYLDNKKYPFMRGSFYTCSNEDVAIENALNDQKNETPQSRYLPFRSIKT